MKSHVNTVKKKKKDHNLKGKKITQRLFFEHGIEELRFRKTVNYIMENGLEERLKIIHLRHGADLK